MTRPASWKYWPTPTYQHVLAKRPPAYAEALEACIVERDAGGFYVDQASTAWLDLSARFARVSLAHGAAGLIKAALNLDPVSADVLDSRRRTCAACMENDGGALPKCKQCRCVIASKTKLAAEACPLGLWLAVVAD